ncbi:hypothetical protein J2Y67_005285 [Neobacillus niacini]|nr:hypothetical protein [Neobacillus niacini]
MNFSPFKFAIVLAKRIIFNPALEIFAVIAPKGGDCYGLAAPIKISGDSPLSVETLEVMDRC